MIEYHITHKTTFDYSEVVSRCHNESRISIRSLPGQRCFTTAIYVTPRPVMFQERVDYFGNRVAYFAIEEPHTQLEVEAISRVEVELKQRPVPPRDPEWQEARQYLEEGSSEDLLMVRQYMMPSPFVEFYDELRQYGQQFFQNGTGLLQGTYDLISDIYRSFEYDPRFSTISTPILEVFTAKRGVCQDFAHLVLGCLRALGFAARYVSGYLETRPPPGQPKLQGVDASHAWISIYEPLSGSWIDYDPTNGVRTADAHITAAWGRDYSDVSPIRGVLFGGGTHQVKVAVDVTRLGES